MKQGGTTESQVKGEIHEGMTNNEKRRSPEFPENGNVGVPEFSGNGKHRKFRSFRCIDPIFWRARARAYLKFLPFVRASRIPTIPLSSAFIPAFRHLPAPLTIPDSASIDPSILRRSRPRFNHIFIYSDSYLLFDFSASWMRFLLSFDFQTYA